MWIRSRLTENVAPPEWAPQHVKYRQLTGGGIIVCTEDQWNHPPELGEWHMCSGWEIMLRHRELPPLRNVQIDETGQMRFTAADGTLVPCVVARNFLDQEYVLPVIYGHDGECLLQRKWGRSESGVPTKIASEYQQKLIDAADACKQMLETVAVVGDQAQMEVESDVLSVLMAAPYHIPDDAPLPLGLIDDRVGCHAVFAALGQMSPDESDG